MKFDPLTGQWEDSAPLQGPFDSRGNVPDGLPATPRFEDFNNYFTSLSNFAVNTPVVVFSPDKNTSGAIIVRGYCRGASASNFPRLAFMAYKTSPNDLTDAAIISEESLLAGTYYSGASIKKPIYIPPGFGVCALSDIATISPSICTMIYYLYVRMPDISPIKN